MTSSLYFSHSAAQAAQTSAQNVHHRAVSAEPRAITRAHAWQTSAHSRHRRTQSAMSGLPMQKSEQASQLFVQS